MTERKNEFLALLCNLYLIALLVALPLYTGEGYWCLGDTKYRLFRNVSLLCLGVWLAVGMPGRVRMLAAWCKARHREETSDAGRAEASKQGGAGRHFSVMDCAVAAYGVCAVASALCSSYGRLAWAGYDGWYMGAVSQLLFVGIYFFVSRQYDGGAYPFYLGEGAFALVTLLGLLHRLGIDPLRLHAGYNSGDWEYSHMISTLGNINWLCGFYSVALAFSMAHYLWEERRAAKCLLCAVNVSAFLLLFIQGSYSGLLLPAVCVCVGFWFYRGDAGRIRRVLAVPVLAFLLMPVWERLMGLMGDRASMALDGNLFAITEWYGWWIGAAVCLLAIRALGRLPAQALVRLTVWLFILGGAACVLAGCLWLYRGGFGDDFGSGRGFLWRISLEGFKEAGWKDKLLGAGPDCFAPAVFERYAAQTNVWEGSYWDGMVFTNAHSEPLTALVDMGILGAVCYLGIYGAGLGRNRRSILGLLALSMYGVYALVSFQQVLSTPFLFLALGLCECRAREAQAGSLT